MQKKLKNVNFFVILVKVLVTIYGVRIVKSYKKSNNTKGKSRLTYIPFGRNINVLLGQS